MRLGKVRLGSVFVIFLGMIAEAASGLGRSVDWSVATEAALQQASLGVTPHIIFVYITDRLSPAADRIRALIRRRTGANIVTGTIGVGVCGVGDEAMDEAAVSILALRLKDASLAREVIWDKDDGREFLAENTSFRGLVAQMHTHSSMVPRLLSREDDTKHWLCGGLTSSRGPQAQFSTHKILEHGATGVIFSRETPIQVGLAQGCVPLGPMRRVTAVVGTVVLTIDNRAALDVLEQDIASLNITEPREIGRQVCIGVTLPHRDKHDYLVRNLTGLGGADRAISVGHQFRLGDTFQFVTRDADSARVEMRQMLESLASRMPKPAAGIYVSCVARGGGLFGEPDVEPSLIQDVFGDIPIAGFFSGGEIYNRELYAHSGVLTLLG